jgi:hypothetical protein
MLESNSGPKCLSAQTEWLLKPTFDQAGIRVKGLPISEWHDASDKDRSGKEWLQSMILYCEWRAAKGRQGHLSHEKRWSEDRWWYINGAKAITDILYT